MTTLLAFLVAIAVLVTFHELGHYCVAKLCGVKVLRFSIGFGRPLVSWHMFDTEWTLCPIPLGGYVRMLDERETPVTAAEMPRTFNAQGPWRRIAIVAAGPLANLLLAVLLYWAVIAGGVVQLRPLVGTVAPQSPAASAGFHAGDRIERIAGRPVDNWHDIRLALLDAAADGPVELTVEDAAGTRLTRRVDPSRFSPRDAQAYQSGDIGLIPVRYLPVVGAIEPGGAAAQAGLKVGDRLVSVDGRVLPDWQSWVALVRDNPGRALSIVVQRGGQSLTLVLRPSLMELPQDGFAGHVGLAPQMDAAWLTALQYTRHYDLAGSARQALFKTGDTCWLSIKFIGRMLSGTSSMDNLSGPLTIASVAGQSARQGLVAYLEFLALISISIGVLNLLPIPVLDGGQLMYYTAELVRGKPLSERAQLVGQRIGLALLFALMAFAMLNDISRLFGG